MIRVEESSEKIPQLVKVIGACEIYIMTGVDLTTFLSISDAKDHHRNILPQPRKVTYMACGSKDIQGQPAQT